MAYELHHKNDTTSPILEAGRYRYAFSPETPYEELKFVHDGQIGDWHFDQVMLNQGAFKQYEENTNTESMLGTAFSHIEKLQSFVTNEDGELTRSVEEGMDYTLRKYIDIIEGTSSETLDTAHGVYRTIQNSLTKETTRFILDDSNFLVSLNQAMLNEDGELSNQLSVIHATYNNLSLGLFGEEGMITGIGMVESGMRLKGELIHLEADKTLVDNAFITNAMIGDATITNAKILNGTIGSAKIANLDVAKLTGGFANFMDALFESKNSTLTINGNDVNINTQVGNETRFLRLNYHGLELRRGTSKLGHLGSAITNTIFLGANVGSKIGLGYQGSNSSASNTYFTAIEVDGTTGLIRMDRAMETPFNIQNTSGNGFNIGNFSSGWVFNSTNNAKIYMYTNGDIGLSFNSSQVYRVSQIYSDIGTINTNVNTVNTRVTTVRDNLQDQINALRNAM